jgi:FkbM family methyltransferase
MLFPETPMKHECTAIVKNTPLYSAYRYFAIRRARKQLRNDFWKWTSVDQRRLEFYAQFIRRGDLVFDVGANLGNRSKVFAKMGAVVVAIEPQEACANHLSSVFHLTPQFHLVRTALGASVGRVEMLIANANTVSSLSPDWVHAVQSSGRFPECEWSHTAMVSVDTLDNLIDRFGCPAFVKVDVEGFEEQVIAGLSMPVPFISFEFTPEFIEGTVKCITRLCSIADTRFQLSLGESMEFMLPEWVTGDMLRHKLSDVSSSAFGDIYARSCC